MYNMCAEHIATMTGTGLLWHALDGDGNALCARIFIGKAPSAQDGLCDREDYCHSCMDALADAVRTYPVATDSRTPTDGAVQQNTGIVAPSPESHPHGQ
ncbi:hypothetical protein ACWGI8_36430 [Streptomyces sp. NPDC054841]